jgi:hypothetical protein
VGTAAAKHKPAAKEDAASHRHGAFLSLKTRPILAISVQYLTPESAFLV